MAGSKTNAFSADIMGDLFGYSTAILTDSSGFWIHLYHTTLNSAVTPATTGRCPGANYDPINVAKTTVQWNNPTTADPSVTSNKLELTFTTSASTGWANDGTLKSILITSSSGTGSVAYWWGDLSTAQTVSSGNTVKFSTAALQITET